MIALAEGVMTPPAGVIALGLTLISLALALFSLALEASSMLRALILSVAPALARRRRQHPEDAFALSEGGERAGAKGQVHHACLRIDAASTEWRTIINPHVH